MGQVKSWADIAKLDLVRLKSANTNTFLSCMFASVLGE